MALVALIGDTHAGCRSESTTFFDNADAFYRDVFFPTLDEHNIKTVVHLGDLVDRRKYIAFVTANRLRRGFIDPLLDRGMELIIIPGNHDIPYRNMVSVNAQREILPNHPKVRVVDAPQLWNLHERMVLMLPWICDENRGRSLEMIKARGTRYAIGHLELAGFEMYRGSVNEHGMSPSLFTGYDKVFSGHYHHRSEKGNIHYLGAPFEMTWSDYSDPRGFHVLDTETMETAYVPNPNTVFAKVHYDDEAGNPAAPDGVAGKVVKLVVKNKTNPLTYDMFVDSLERVCADVQVVEDHHHADDEAVEDIVQPISDTLELLSKCVEDSGISCDKPALNRLLAELYQRAQEVE